MKPRKVLSIRVVILCLWALALAAIVVVLGPDGVLRMYGSLTPQGIKGAIDSFGMFSVLAFLAASVLRPLLFVPLTALTVASGFMFGMWWGLFWAMTGSTLSAIFVFFFSRYILHDYIAVRLKGKYPAFDRALEGGSWNMVLFLRMIPMLPFDIVSCFAGASSICFRDFLVGTFLGELPGAVVLVMLGTSFEDVGSWFFYLSIALAVAMFIATEVARRWINRRKRIFTYRDPNERKTT